MRRLLIPPVVFALAALAMLGLDRIVAGPMLATGPARTAAEALAVALALAALGLAVAALRAFRRAGTGPEPWASPSALVTRGPYRFSRNPMYLALLLLLVALALALGSLAAALVLPAFVVGVDRLFIRREERLLADRFGADFARWRARVRRWL